MAHRSVRRSQRMILNGNAMFLRRRLEWAACSGLRAIFAAALDNYKAAHAIRERLAATDPGNTGWQTRSLRLP